MMQNQGEKISKQEALTQIHLALRRATLLYHSFSEILVGEFGEKRGRELVQAAIEKYGTMVGQAAKEKAEKKGLDLKPENFESDLPTLAWRTEEVVVDGEKRKRVYFCPIASELMQLGGPREARLYCWVDQAKMHAFNPEYEYLHLKNIIDGDPFCELVVRPVMKREDSP